MGKIQTYGGRFIDPLDPDPTQLDIVDLAHALSNVCRFNGHVREFYSVGQHSVLVMQYLQATIFRPSRQLLTCALVHDLSESLLWDVPSPIKGCVPDYKAMEAKTQDAIYKKFAPLGIPSDGIRGRIKVADKALLALEANALMPRMYEDMRMPSYRISIRPWSPKLAETMFLKQYNWLKADEFCPKTTPILKS